MVLECEVTARAPTIAVRIDVAEEIATGNGATRQTQATTRQETAAVDDVTATIGIALDRKTRFARRDVPNVDELTLRVEHGDRWNRLVRTVDTSVFA